MPRRNRTKGRNITGVLLLDKPLGLTSNEALQQVKSLYQARKAGHTGSLDKAASGLLPLCFGEATKFSGFLLNADKHYHTVFQLGAQTSTGDAEGEVVFRGATGNLSQRRVAQTLAAFHGAIMQVPPMFSALKHKGERLYKLAHQGLEVEREPREITIHNIDLLDYRETRLELDIRCSKGTYIRTLAEDIGKELGCGAHVQALRRIGVGPYTAANMVTLATLEHTAAAGVPGLDELLLDIDSVVRDMPAVHLIEAVAFYLCQGQPVTVPQAPTQGLLRIYREDQRFLGVGEVLPDGRVAPKRLVS
ncbi:MAG: tRNA pseudouridine(55) synthase TruB [Gammaproteobacteria bacterium]|nr:tRNA pseudouridine(55) synthase TruB [Gammaproteobacteria bacterium]MCY4210578.1 tRNA pseudouridine(55) synthase TruB [Gammaproteobacteria bacterium]MCY4282824.1 tRNA pseudouridine(55) synthase TruB [Gammaproteobacteria bacterium]MCY4337353.1 tRNA pseudouridine(55) synthase TruB [Gammaproteobacteria bacterium]